MSTPRPPSQAAAMRQSAFYRKMVILLLALLVGCAVLAFFVIGRFAPAPPAAPAARPPAFFASIDTMKESKDTETHPLPQQEITSIVDLSASLNSNYITIDTDWDYAAYMQQWVNAVRSTGRRVWFRIHPTHWEHSDSIADIMTPAQYFSSERAFIASHPSLFRPGDILDACPEPENGLYWDARYGKNWSVHAPNTATRDFNRFLRETTDTADSALHQRGIYNVITTLRSTDPFIPTHPGVLERATASRFGFITVDSYPDQDTTDPATAAVARVSELSTIEHIWHLPIVIGEMGYSNEINVDDATQRAVLSAEFDAIARLPYIAGANYWVGPGTQWSGGYTHIFVQSGSTWSLRPAAYVLSRFFKAKVYGHA
jgi:hypothetical protein